MIEPQTLDLSALLARGFSVVVTDYQGIGTPGGHAYLQPVPESHAVLDAARAAIRLGVTAPNAPVGIWGYSQGGGAAAAAAEQARSYAPDLRCTSREPGDGGHDLATLEHVHGRDGGDAVACGHGGILIDADFHGYHLLGVLLGDLVEDRRQRATRSAPFGPEIDNDGFLGPQDIGLEAGIGDILGGRVVSFLPGAGSG